MVLNFTMENLNIWKVTAKKIRNNVCKKIILQLPCTQGENFSVSEREKDAVVHK